MELKMYRSLGYIGFAVSMLLPVCHAQPSAGQVGGQGGNQGNALDSGLDGARLYEVSVFTGYSTSANPVIGGYLTTPGVGALNADENYGVSAAVGWQHHREKDSFSIRYSGSYSGMVHYTGGNGYSQWLNLNADRKLGRKWAFTLSGTGQDATLIQVINEPTALATTSQMATDFNDFAAAFGLGTYSTAQAGSIILGAPVVQAPLQALLLGDKVVSYSGNVGLSYAISQHFSFHVSGFAEGGQSRAPYENGVPTVNYALPNGLGADAGISWTYAASPRTDFGINLDINHLQNHFQDVNTSTATASFGRKMGEHWFAKMYGGATYTDVVQQTSGSPVERQAVGGASLGVKTYSNTFAASYNRTASDAYGSVVGTYTTVSGTWTWRRRGSRIWTEASFGQQKIGSTGFESLSGWTANAGVTERLTGNTILNESYVYLKTEGNYLGSATNLSIQSVRLLMSWSPQVMQR
jgi:hypothetical protein